MKKCNGWLVGNAVALCSAGGWTMFDLRVAVRMVIHTVDGECWVVYDLAGMSPSAVQVEGEPSDYEWLVQAWLATRQPGGRPVAGSEAQGIDLPTEP